MGKKLHECAFWLNGSCRFENKKCWNKNKTSIKNIKTEPKLIMETEQDLVSKDTEDNKPEVEELMKVIVQMTALCLKVKVKEQN